MRSLLSAAILGLLVSFGALPAQAEIQSKRIYAAGAWEVRLVADDSGLIQCLAQVTDAGYSFSIWASPGRPVQLQFYSQAWSFDGGTANLRLRIDGNPPWRLTDAELYKQSVLFNLPNTNAGSRFLLEVARGNRLVLSSDSGRQVHIYSLYGSSASIRTLIDCVDALRSRSDSNPFD